MIGSGGLRLTTARCCAVRFAPVLGPSDTFESNAASKLAHSRLSRTSSSLNVRRKIDRKKRPSWAFGRS
jgi:hypothetical protein